MTISLITLSALTTTSTSTSTSTTTASSSLSRQFLATATNTTTSSLTPTILVLPQLTTPFTPPPGCTPVEQWTPATITIQSYGNTTYPHIFLPVTNARYSACQPSGWDAIDRKYHFSYSNAVCPSGYNYNQLADLFYDQTDTDSIPTTAYCCPSGFTYTMFFNTQVINLFGANCIRTTPMSVMAQPTSTAADKDSKSTAVSESTTTTQVPGSTFAEPPEPTSTQVQVPESKPPEPPEPTSTQVQVPESKPPGAPESVIEAPPESPFTETPEQTADEALDPPLEFEKAPRSVKDMTISTPPPKIVTSMATMLYHPWNIVWQKKEAAQLSPSPPQVSVASPVSTWEPGTEIDPTLHRKPTNPNDLDRKLSRIIGITTGCITAFFLFGAAIAMFLYHRSKKKKHEAIELQERQLQEQRLDRIREYQLTSASSPQRQPPNIMEEDEPLPVYVAATDQDNRATTTTATTATTATESAVAVPPYRTLPSNFSSSKYRSRNSRYPSGGYSRYPSGEYSGNTHRTHGTGIDDGRYGQRFYGDEVTPHGGVFYRQGNDHPTWI